MRTLITSIMAICIMISPFIYNAVGKQTCTIDYDTSFNGLWLLKVETCRGPVGVVTSDRTIARQALFRRF